MKTFTVECDNINNSAIKEINDTFNPKEFFITHDNCSLTINVDKLDFIKLKNILLKYDKNTQNTVTDSVKKLGSYTVIRGKRQYNFKPKKKPSNQVKYWYADTSSTGKINTPLETDVIICGDSETELSKMPNNCIDMIFTSPPYNFGRDYDNYDDVINYEEYFKKLYSILNECKRVLKPGGRLVINVQPVFSDYIPTHHFISMHLVNSGMIWRGEIIWDKRNFNCKTTAWGSWKSPSSPYLKYTWEFVEVFCKESLKKAGNASDADITADNFKKWVNAKWEISPERNMKQYDHPAMFPEELARRALQLFSFKGDVILDPFCGAGTTCVVAKKTGRKYIGIDVSEKYCKTTKSRIGNIISAYNS